MPVRWKREWLSACVVLISIVAGSGASITVLSVGVHAQVADCSADPTTVAPGETVTLDASSSDANYVEFDKEGDEEYELVDETDFIVNVSYEMSGTYDPVTRADGEDTDPCGRITVNEPPSASIAASPNPSTTGETVTFDASDSTDSDGEIVEYRWDFNGDGEVDNATSDSQVQHTYTQAGGYDMTLTVVDDDGATDTTVQDVIVEESAVARCTVEPTSATTDETVTINATDSENGEVIDYDVDGDGSYEVVGETSFTLDRSYDSPDTYSPSIRVREGERADTADCGTVTIAEPNDPPVPDLSIAPRPGIVGQQITFDASNSTDPDGRIVEYRWDFDGDGSVDNVTSDPVTTHRFDNPDLYVSSVTVVDDDNATRRTGNELPIQEATTTTTRSPDTELRCTVTPSSASTGEPVVIDASESTGVTVIDYDVDGDGEYERRERTNLTTTVRYDDSGTYQPRVRVHLGDRTADCGTTSVDAENQPPVAELSVEPSIASTGELVLFNASESYDPDGRIVAYHWDFNGNGTIDAVNNASLVQHVYPETNQYAPTLVVVDDDGATDQAELRVRVLPGPLLPGLQWLLPLILGCVLGLVLCRKGYVPNPFGGGTAGSGVTAHAAGTFETPPGGGTVEVDGLGFEPDLLLFTATNNVPVDGPGLGRTDGWTYGTAQRDSDGTVRQQAVGVANDARQTESGVAAATQGRVVDLLIHDEDGANALLGAVEGTTADGFEVALDASALPDHHASESYVVMYEAFETAEGTDVDTGVVQTPAEASVQTEALGTDADYVALTAVEPLEVIDEERVTAGSLGLSHGVATSEESLSQHVIAQGVDSSAVGPSNHAAYDDRAIHLLHADGPEIAGRTSARVTGLSDELELTYDAVYEPDDESSDEREASDGEDGDRAGAPPRLVTYVAVDTGDGPAPAVGEFELPAGDEADQRVDTGFEPAVVDFTAGTAADVGTERTVATDPLAFGWSHGVATVDPAGTVDHHVLHSSVTATEVSGRAPIATPDSGRSTPSAAEGGDDTATADGGVTARTKRTGAGVVAFVLDGDGGVIGRDTVQLTGVDRTGFEIETERLGQVHSGDPTERRPMVFYTAWHGEGVEEKS